MDTPFLMFLWHFTWEISETYSSKPSKDNFAPYNPFRSLSFEIFLLHPQRRHVYPYFQTSAYLLEQLDWSEMDFSSVLTQLVLWYSESIKYIENYIPHDALLLSVILSWSLSITGCSVSLPGQTLLPAPLVSGLSSLRDGGMEGREGQNWNLGIMEGTLSWLARQANLIFPLVLFKLS